MGKNFLDASLRPPPYDHQPPDEAAAPGSWAMLDIRAYVADRRNATTAYGQMSNGVAPPPVVSYFCVWCPEPARLAEIGTEPRIIAAEADLAVLLVGFGPGLECTDPRCQDILVYHAGGGEKRPSLRLVTKNDDDPYCLFFNVGILRHRSDIYPDDDEYHIVGMGYTKLPWQFKLHLFDSKTGTWSSKRIPVQGREHQHRQFRHAPSKVIMLEEGDLMAFVDPWRGILVGDVLDCEALHYIPFPRTLRKNNKKLRLISETSRDIVVAQGRIKVVDLFYCSASDAWKGSVWSRAATTLENNWDRDCTFEIRDSLVDTNTLHSELLPKLQSDGDSSSQKTLEALYITHPTLSLNDDHGVYFMGMVDYNRAWVLAVDSKNKRLRDVSLLDPLRSRDVCLTYIHSRISKYFKAAPGTKGDLKRLGKFLEGTPFKKQAGAETADDIMQNGAVSSVGYEDHMDLD